jgi:inorganic pyrophosphatase
VIAYATGNARFADIEHYTEVQPHILLEIAHFFSIYKDLEGKRTEALGWKDRQIAYEVIQAAHSRYREKHAAA